MSKENNIPKILLVTATSDFKDYINWKWLDNLKNLTYPVDVLIVDNSKDENYHKKIAEKYPEYAVIHYPQQENEELRTIMAKSDEITRNYAIQHEYDYMFRLECDIFPPTPNIVERLLAHNKYVCGAVYFIRRGHDTDLMVQQIEDERFVNIEVRQPNAQFLFRKKAFLFCDGTLKTVLSAGAGCLLIHKAIFRRIPYRVVENEDGFADSFWSRDLHEMNIDYYVDTSLICEHYNSDWNNIKEIYKKSNIKQK